MTINGRLLNLKYDRGCIFIGLSWFFALKDMNSQISSESLDPPETIAASCTSNEYKWLWPACSKRNGELVHRPWKKGTIGKRAVSVKMMVTNALPSSFEKTYSI